MEQFFTFFFTERDRQVPSGTPKKRKKTVRGLNELDARLNLSKALHKRGTQLHAMLEIRTRSA